ncbi:hypothetical protein Tco_0105602 [Tanacetum coccineum]
MYDSWKSIMELYMLNRQHGRMILKSVENGPLIWPSIEENGVTRLKKYYELSATEAIQVIVISKAKQMNYSQRTTTWCLCITIAIISCQGNFGKEFNFSCKETSCTKQGKAGHGDDPIDVINHMMSFLTTVVTFRYPTTNNQLRNSSNPRQQATINNGRVTLQPVHGRQTSIATGGTTRNHPEQVGSTFWEIKAVIYPGIPEGQATQTVITHNVAYQADDLDAYDFDCDELNTAKVALMANLSHYGSDALVKLERYKEQVKVLKEGKNVDLRSNDTISDLSAQSVNIDRLKQTLSEHLKEKESLMQTNTSAIVILDSKKTLLLAEESRSKMLLKQKDPMMLEKKVNTTPVDYDVLNQLSQDFETRFVLKTELSAEQAFGLEFLEFSDPNLSSIPTKVKVPKELPKVSMVNTSLKKLKHNLAGFDVVVKERTTPIAITKGLWGFEHTKAYFRDEIIPFVKALKELFNTFDQYLIDELSEVQNVFHQIEQAVEQHLISKDIVNTIVNSSVDIASVNVHECEKCLKLETELLNKKDFIEKEIYDKLDNSISNQSAPSFDQLFELNELKAQSQKKDTVIKKLKDRIKTLSGKMYEDKIKKDLEEIETINIKLDHRVSKLIVENEHLKQTYKQLYDLIKPARIRSKEHCDDLINQVNLNSVEISDLNASLQEKVLEITALKDDLRKLKGKDLVDNAVTKHTIDPEMLKIDVEPITPKLLNKRTTHSAYIKHTQEEAAVLRDLFDHVKANYPLDHSLEFACRYTKLILELLTNISKTCPSINNSGEQLGKLVAVTPKNKDKRVRFTEPVTSSGNTIIKTTSTSNLVSNKPMLSSTGVKPSTSASGSQPSGNTKKDKIQQTPRTANVQHSKLNANSELKCVKCNGCMLSDNHDLCVLDFINNVNARVKSKSVKKTLKKKVWKPKGKVFTNIRYIWRATGRTFTIVGNACPLMRIATTTEVPLRIPSALDNETPKPVVTLVYSWKPRKSKTNAPLSKFKVVQIVLWYLGSGCSKHITEDRSQLTNFVNKVLGIVKFRNDHVAKILGYGDYQIGNVTISRVYYMEGLGHNLFSIGHFCVSNLEVTFRQHTCFIRNLEGVDLLTGSQGNNLYTLSLGDMMASSPICLCLI